MPRADLSLLKVLRALWDGLIEQGKVTLGATFALAFLESLRRQYHDADREKIRELAEQAQNIRIEQVREALGDLRVEVDELRQQMEEITLAVVEYLAEKAEFPARLGDIESKLREIRELSERTLANTDRIYRIVVETRDSVLRLGEKSERLEHESGGYHAEIDRAAQCLKEKKPEAALVLLESLCREHWDRMTNRERFRVEANVGHAYMRQGKYEDAAKQFLRARQHQPDDEDAIQLAIRAKAILKDWEGARQLVDEAREKFPESATILGLWMEIHAGEMDFCSLEKVAPRHMRNTYQVACALAGKAARERIWEKAEHYARLAREAEPEEPYGCILLGQIILERESDTCNSRPCQQGQVRTERMKEALEHLTVGLEALGKPMARDISLRALISRGVAHALLGEAEPAEQDLLQAYTLDPRDADACYNLALWRVKRGDRDRGIELLSTECEREQPIRNSVLLAELLLERGREGDIERARDILVDRLGELEHWDPIYKVRYARAVVNSLLFLNEITPCLQLLDSPPMVTLPPEVRLTLLAKTQLRAENRHAAARTARRACETVTEQTDRLIVRELALVLYRLREYEQCKKLLAGIVKPVSITDEVKWLLDCALKTRDDGCVLRLCRSLRDHGEYDADTVDAEVVTLIKYKAYPEAIAILKDVIENRSQGLIGKLARTRLSQVGIILGEPELIESDPTKLPSPGEATPDLGRQVTQVLVRSRRPERALDYAYELYRQHPDDSDAWAAVVESCTLDLSAGMQLKPLDNVCVGCAVEYRDEATGTHHWCVVEDSPDPKPSLNEFPPDHPLCSAMLGKSVGETFEMPNSNRFGTIIRIVDKRLYRWHECAHDMARKYPEETIVWSFSAERDPELNQMAAVLRRRQEAIDKCYEAYRNNPLPIWFLSPLAGKNTFQTALMVAGEASLPVRCCFGNVREAQQAGQTVRQARTIVLAPTAIATLFVVNKIEEVLGWPVEFVITQGVLDEVKEALRSLEREGTDHLHLAWNRETQRIVVSQDEAQEEVTDKLRRLHEILQQKARVESGLALLGVQTGPREQLVEVIGQTSAESVALTGELNAVLWSDDCVVAALAARELKVQSVWTQVVFDYATARGWSERTCHADVSFTLLACNYRHTAVTPELVFEAIQRSRWDVDSRSLCDVLDQFANDDLVAFGLLLLAGATICWAWQHCQLHHQAETLTVRVLERLMSRKRGHEIVRGLAERIEMFFGLDVVNAERVRKFIELWLKGTGRITLP